MSLLPPLWSRSRNAWCGSPARLAAGHRQRSARGRTVRGTGPVRLDHRCADEQPGGRHTRYGLERRLAAAGRLGWVRPVHHRLRRVRRLACRPAGAPTAPGGPDQLFRSHPAAAADLPHRRAFGPADEGDAAGHRRALAHLARLLPRALRLARLADRAAAAIALPELAAGDPAVHAVRRVHGADDHRRAQDPRHAERGRGALFRRSPNAPPTRSATSRWCRASCASTPRCRISATSPIGCCPHRCRCCRGGRWSR